MPIQNNKLASTDRRWARVDIFYVDDAGEVVWENVKIDFKKVTGAVFAELNELEAGSEDKKTRLSRQLAFLEVGSDEIKDGDSRATLTLEHFMAYDLQNLQAMMDAINAVTFPKKPTPETSKSTS